MHLERIGEAWQTQGRQRHAKENQCLEHWKESAMVHGVFFYTAHRHVSIDVFRLILQIIIAIMWLVDNKHDKKMGDDGISPIYDCLHT